MRTAQDESFGVRWRRRRIRTRERRCAHGIVGGFVAGCAGVLRKLELPRRYAARCIEVRQRSCHKEFFVLLNFLGCSAVSSFVVVGRSSRNRGASGMENTTAFASGTSFANIKDAVIGRLGLRPSQAPRQPHPQQETESSRGIARCRPQQRCVRRIASHGCPARRGSASPRSIVFT